MRKADSLRAWLTAYLPDLKRHPDRLQIYTEGGSIAARRSRTLSFEYRFTLKALVTDYAGDTDALVVPLLAWIEKEQPDLLQRGEGDPFEFEADQLDAHRYDLLFSIELTEPVVVLPRPGGGFDVSHPAHDFTDAFDGVGASWLRQCYGGRDLLAESRDPAAQPLSPHIPPDAPEM